MSTAESKIGKNFSRSMGRAKEKILQNLGKVDRTADEIFDDHVSNFSKQQLAATRLQKELNNYIRCIRACAAANKSLLEAVTDIYEPEWGDKELLNVNSQNVEMLWNDFAHRLAEQVLIPLNTYQGQFPEMRKKIEKRGRKLVDFDGERHALQALQSNPRRAEAKLSRQRENLEAAKRTYEVLNSELHEELPSLYGSRIVFLVSAMSTLFASENIFHSESAKVYQEYEGVVERLAKESAKGTLNFKSSNNAVLNNRDAMKDDNKGERSTPTTPTVKSSKQVVAELGGFVNDNDQAHAAPSTPPQRPPHPSTPIKEKETNDKTYSAENESPSTSLSLSNPPQSETKDHEKSNPDTLVNMTNNNTASPSPPTTPSGTKSLCNGEQVLSNGACDKETAVNEDMKLNNGCNASMKADTTAAATTTADAKAESEKHAELKNVDDVDANDKPIAESKHSLGQTVNGDHQKINGNHSPTENAQTNGKIDDLNDDAVAEKNGETKAEDPKISSSSASANVKSSSTPADSTTPTSSTNQTSNADATSNSNSPTVETSKEPGVLYRVRATYRYQKEDEDELSFDAGEIIRVIEYDDPEEQEEGWLMGAKDNGEKGMFPANFTRPI